MTLQEFINQIPQVILERGRDYLEYGNIIELAQCRQPLSKATMETTV